MSESTLQELPEARAGRGRGVKCLPALAAVLLVGLTLYASRASVLPPAETGQALQASGGDKGDDKATAKAVAAANAFLDLLDAKQRSKALLDFDSGKKAAWSNLPVTMVARNGVPLADLTKAQRAAALDAVAAVLSKQGYQKVIDIMNGDDQLVKGKDNKVKFGTDNYYLAIFGKPSAKEPWMLQFGGHHLGINVTIIGKNAVLTPTHTGAQPTSFTRDGKTVRPLGVENDLAFKLIDALDDKQRKQAILSAKPINLLLGPGKDDKTLQPVGIKGSALTEAQSGVLLNLIGAWVNILPDDAAASRMAEIKTKLGDTYFAWYGPTTKDSAVYYRIQGPTLVIEYAPQGGTNHIHTIIRDPSNDYGKQLIKN
jgi:hypothetical protein